jgi:hypothetical protein
MLILFGYPTKNTQKRRVTRPLKLGRAHSLLTKPAVVPAFLLFEVEVGITITGRPSPKLFVL